VHLMLVLDTTLPTVRNIKSCGNSHQKECFCTFLQRATCKKRVGRISGTVNSVSNLQDTMHKVLICQKVSPYVGQQNTERRGHASVSRSQSQDIVVQTYFMYGRQQN
jgi:hypothetical protein